MHCNARAVPACLACNTCSAASALHACSEPPVPRPPLHLAAQSGPAISTLAFYYILDGSIYQAPSLQAALQARMVSRGGRAGAAWQLGVVHCCLGRA